MHSLCFNGHDSFMAFTLAFDVKKFLWLSRQGQITWDLAESCVVTLHNLSSTDSLGSLEQILDWYQCNDGCSFV